MFAHKGDLADVHQNLILSNHQTEGETDSEQAFCYLMDQISFSQMVIFFMHLLMKELNGMVKLDPLAYIFSYVISIAILLKLKLPELRRMVYTKSRSWLLVCH